MKEIPEFIPIKSSYFEKYGLPFAPGTVRQHRARGGVLRRYTIKDPSGRVLFCLRKYFEDVKRSLGREDNYDWQRS